MHGLYDDNVALYEQKRSTTVTASLPTHHTFFCVDPFFERTDLEISAGASHGRVGFKF